MAAMDQEATMWIKKEETDEVPCDPGSMFLEDPLGASWSIDGFKDPRLNLGWDETECTNSETALLDIIQEAETECCPPPLLVTKKLGCGMAAMEQGTIMWIKEEETDELPHEPGSVFLEDPLNIEEPSLDIKQGQELKQHAVGSKHNLFAEPFLISGSTDYIKEDPELNLEADGTENIVVASPRYGPDSTRLIQNNGESWDISFEDNIKEGMVGNKLEISGEESKYFTMFGTNSQGVTGGRGEEEGEEEEEETLFDTRLKFSLRGKEFHKLCCSVCLQTFLSKYSLIMHVFIHIDGVQPPKHVCKSCGEVFPSNISLTKHMKMNYGDRSLSVDHNDKFDCIQNNEKNFVEHGQQVIVKECIEKQFSSKETRKMSKKPFNDIYRTHTVTDNAEKRDGYDYYGTSSTTNNVIDHGVLLTAKRLHKCVCGKSFTQSANLKRHILRHTGTRPHKCHVCGKSFARVDCLKGHALTHTGQKPYKCDVCGNSFTQLGNLKRHILRHSGTRPHKCNVCGKSFTNLASLKQHALTHTGQRPRPHKCEVCGKSFTLLGYLRKHGLIHSGLRPHRCNVCGKSFINLGNLNTHMLIHTGTRPHQCDDCGMSFKRSHHLKSHLLTHTGMRPHKCNVCGKSFSQLGNLTNHSLIHTGIRPHTCDICGKSFTLLGDLKKHKLIHSGIKQYKCDVCGKNFYQSGNLKSHSLIHTGMRPFKCDVCGKSFTWSHALKTHSLLHTGKKSLK